MYCNLRRENCQAFVVLHYFEISLLLVCVPGKKSIEPFNLCSKLKLPLQQLFSLPVRECIMQYHEANFTLQNMHLLSAPITVYDPWHMYSKYICI